MHKISEKLDPDSPLPLHVQIEHQIRRIAAEPNYQRGALMPDEVWLANRFGVSRGTVRTALIRLVHQGLLERKAGIGTRVISQSPKSNIYEWKSFTAEMNRAGKKVENYLLNVKSSKAPSHVAQALKITQNSKVIVLDRVRGLENQPMVFSRSWFHPRLKLDESCDFSQPIYQMIQEKTGCTVSSASENFTAVLPTEDHIHLLKIKANTPLLKRCHTVFDAARKAVEYAEVYYVSSRFILTMDLSG